MKYILGKKLSMTQVFDEEGQVHPVTIVEAGNNVVTQLKDLATDGYKAVQVGFGERREKNIAKAQKGHVKGAGSFSYFREFRLKDDDEVPELGTKIDVSTFEPGDTVSVSGISKGKGFQGGVKRYGFKGGPRSHGQKHSEREVGSIGATGPQRVFKGTRMPGRMGTDRITVRNLKIVQVSPEHNQILVSGAVPGRRGTVVEIKAK